MGNKFKTIVLCLAIALGCQAEQASASAISKGSDLLTINSREEAASIVRFADGSVVVIGDDLVVETDSPNPTISWVLVDDASTGLQAAFYSGCGSFYCIYGISSLPSGTYNVTVQTSAGRFFKGGIVVP